MGRLHFRAPREWALNFTIDRIDIGIGLAAQWMPGYVNCTLEMHVTPEEYDFLLRQHSHDFALQAVRELSRNGGLMVTMGISEELAGQVRAARDPYKVLLAPTRLIVVPWEPEAGT